MQHKIENNVAAVNPYGRPGFWPRDGRMVESRRSYRNTGHEIPQHQRPGSSSARGGPRSGDRRNHDPCRNRSSPGALSAPARSPRRGWHGGTQNHCQACRWPSQTPIPGPSALAAIFFGEPELELHIRMIHDAERCRISAANFVELSLVEHAHLARQAFLDFGKGRHPAKLNFGDCFAHALAKATGEPLLF